MAEKYRSPAAIKRAEQRAAAKKSKAAEMPPEKAISTGLAETTARIQQRTSAPRGGSRTPGPLEKAARERSMSLFGEIVKSKKLTGLVTGTDPATGMKKNISVRPEDIDPRVIGRASLTGDQAAALDLHTRITSSLSSMMQRPLEGSTTKGGITSEGDDPVSNRLRRLSAKKTVPETYERQEGGRKRSGRAKTREATPQEIAPEVREPKDLSVVRSEYLSGPRETFPIPQERWTDMLQPRSQSQRRRDRRQAQQATTRGAAPMVEHIHPTQALEMKRAALSQAISQGEDVPGYSASQVGPRITGGMQYKTAEQLRGVDLSPTSWASSAGMSSMSRPPKESDDAFMSRFSNLQQQKGVRLNMKDVARFESITARQKADESRAAKGFKFAADPAEMRRKPAS